MVAIKKHFTSTYDFAKYGGKMRLTLDGSENRKDKFLFYKLSKRKDAKDYILANILKKHDLWIGNLVDDSHEAEEVYTEWSKRQQSLSYVFRNELDELDDDFNANIIVNDGAYTNTIVVPDINKTVNNYKPFIDFDKAKMRKIVLDKYNAIVKYNAYEQY